MYLLDHASFGRVLGTIRILSTRRDAQTLFRGVWTNDVKAIDF